MKLALIGSARFEQDWIKVNMALTLAGHTVYSLSVFPSQANMLEMESEGAEHEWYTSQQKTMLDLVHLAKIEESDAVVLINRDGYVGESTRREMLWCCVREKALLAINPFLGDRMVGQAVTDPEEDFGLPLVGINLNAVREFVFAWQPQG